MFGSGDFWNELLSLFFENFEIVRVKQFTPNHPPKHMITSTNWKL